MSLLKMISTASWRQNTRARAPFTLWTLMAACCCAARLPKPSHRGLRVWLIVPGRYCDRVMHMKYAQAGSTCRARRWRWRRLSVTVTTIATCGVCARFISKIWKPIPVGYSIFRQDLRDASTGKLSAVGGAAGEVDMVLRQQTAVSPEDLMRRGHSSPHPGNTATACGSTWRCRLPIKIAMR